MHRRIHTLATQLASFSEEARVWWWKNVLYWRLRQFGPRGLEFRTNEVDE